MLFLLALIVDQPSPENLAGLVPMVSPAAAISNGNLLERTAEVCGHVIPSHMPGEALLLGGGGYLLVDDGGEPPPAIGSVACVMGVVLRRDGISREETIATGIGFPTVTHAINNAFLLRRCSDRAGCAALVPRWVPGPPLPPPPLYPKEQD